MLIKQESYIQFIVVIVCLRKSIDYSNSTSSLRRDWITSLSLVIRNCSVGFYDVYWLEG